MLQNAVAGQASDMCYSSGVVFHIQQWTRYGLAEFFGP